MCFVSSRKLVGIAEYIKILPPLLCPLQFAQRIRQATVSLLKVGDRGHDFLIGIVTSALLQAARQFCQLPRMSRIVAHHILHQSQHLIHGAVNVLMGCGAVVQMLVAVGMLIRT